MQRQAGLGYVQWAKTAVARDQRVRTTVLADLHEQLKAFYSDIGRPSVDPEL
jgi:hypothetical protein